MKRNARLLAIPLALSAILWGCEDRVSGPGTPRQGPVFAKGGNQGPDQPTDTLTFHFFDRESDLMVGDGRVPDPAGGTDYTNGECGVAAVFWGQNPILSSQNDRIKPSESANCGGTEGRVFEVQFPASFGNGGTLDWDGHSVDAKWLKLRNRSWSPTPVRDLAKGETLIKGLEITFVDQGNHPGGNGWGQACPALLRFDPDWSDPDAGIQVSGVQVTRIRQQPVDDYDEWEITAAPGPDGNGDVAACLAGTNEPYVIGYYHLPFQVNVVCKGEC